MDCMARMARIFYTLVCADAQGLKCDDQLF